MNYSVTGNVTVYIPLRAKFRKVTKKRNLGCEHDVGGCDLELFGRVLLFGNASKSTCESTHSTRCYGVAQDLHIAIVLGVCGLERIHQHIFQVT